MRILVNKGSILNAHNFKIVMGLLQDTGKILNDSIESIAKLHIYDKFCADLALTPISPDYYKTADF